MTKTPSGRRRGVTAALALVLGGSAVLVLPGSGASATRTRIAPQEPTASYVVVLDPGSSAGDVEQVADTARSTGADVTRDMTGVVPAVVVTASDSEVAALQEHPDVAFVEPNHVIRVAATQADPGWGLDRIDQATLPLSGSYSYTGTGAGVRAYIVDSGIRRLHREVYGRVSPGVTFVQDAYGTGDCLGHGTAVASVVGGATKGVAKQVTLVPVRAVNCAGTSDVGTLVAALDWVVANGTRPAVVNLSLTSRGSAAVDAAVGRTIAAGYTVVVAAGNASRSSCLYSPGRVGAAVTVAASTPTDARAPFSNGGGCVDLFAPGENVPAAAIKSATTGLSSNAATTTVSGTSFAAPYVSGAAALALQADPSLTPAQVSAAVTSRATEGVVTNTSGAPSRLLLTSAG